MSLSGSSFKQSELFPVYFKFILHNARTLIIVLGLHMFKILNILVLVALPSLFVGCGGSSSSSGGEDDGSQPEPTPDFDVTGNYCSSHSMVQFDVFKNNLVGFQADDGKCIGVAEGSNRPKVIAVNLENFNSELTLASEATVVESERHFFIKLTVTSTSESTQCFVELKQLSFLNDIQETVAEESLGYIDGFLMSLNDGVTTNTCLLPGTTGDFISIIPLNQGSSVDDITELVVSELGGLTAPNGVVELPLLEISSFEWDSNRRKMSMLLVNNNSESIDLGASFSMVALYNQDNRFVDLKLLTDIDQIVVNPFEAFELTSSTPFADEQGVRAEVYLDWAFIERESTFVPNTLVDYMTVGEAVVDDVALTEDKPILSDYERLLEWRDYTSRAKERWVRLTLSSGE